MRPWVPLVIAGSASAVAQAFGRFSYPLMLTAVQDDLGLSYTVAGGLASANLVAYLVGTIAVTLLATRLLPGMILRVGLTGSVLGLILMTIAPGLGILTLGLFLAGFAGALVWVPAPAVGAALLPDRMRGLAFGSMGAGIGVGIVGAGLLAIPLRASGDPSSWRVLFGVEAFVGLGVLVAALVLLRRPLGAALSTAGVRLSAIRAVPGWVALLAAYAMFGISYAWFFNFLIAYHYEVF